MDAVALWPVVPSWQRARRVEGRLKGFGVKLVFMVSWLIGSGECVFSLVHPLHRDHGSFLETGTGPRHASVYGCY